MLRSSVTFRGHWGILERRQHVTWPIFILGTRRRRIVSFTSVPSSSWETISVVAREQKAVETRILRSTGYCTSPCAVLTTAGAPSDLHHLRRVLWQPLSIQRLRWSKVSWNVARCYIISNFWHILVHFLPRLLSKRFRIHTPVITCQHNCIGYTFCRFSSVLLWRTTAGNKTLQN